MSEPAPAPNATSSRGLLWLLFGATLGLAVLRAPQLLIEPRFWAEEGSVYYSAAHQTRSLGAFVHVARHTAGYLLLSASVPAALAAWLLPVELAPTVTTAAAFAVLATALALIVFGRSLLFQDPARKALACAAVLLAPSSLGEVWLNSTNSQVYCGLISLCILCEDLRHASPRRIALYVALLLFCGLSGVYTSFLFFAFAWKLWRERSRGALAVAGTVALAAAIQFGVFVFLWNERAIHPSKFQELDWIRSATHTFYQQFLVPLGLRPLVQAFGDPAAVLRSLAARDVLASAIAVLGVLGVLAAVAALVDRDPRSPRNGLVIALGSLALLTTLSAKFGTTVGRYAVLSGISLLWLLLAYTQAAPGVARWRPLAAGALFGWALAVGAVGYRDDDAFVCPGGCPRWRDEVARWRRDPGYAPQIWPVFVPRSGPQWRVELAEP